MLMKPSPSVAPMQLLVWLQIYKMIHTGRKPSKKVNPGYFRCAIHSGCLESLKPAYFAFTSLCLFPTATSALQEKQSPIHPRFSSIAVTELEMGLGSCTAAPRMTPRAISFLPPPPSKGFQPSGASSQNPRDGLQSSADPGMGSSKDRTGGWSASCPP